ncbi:MAG: metal-dependent hydrolase [Moraxella sp.]|nr:metal-dependent hydrolase [Moraxella sp.]
MANFRTHLSVAAVVSGGLATVGVHFKLFGLTTALLCAIIGTIGGLLPDIDLEHSEPARRGFFLGSLIASMLITILYANSYRQDELILHSLIVWALSFVVIRFGVIELFCRLTVHRGMVHSVPYMAVFGLLVVHGVFYGLQMTTFVSWVFGVFLFIGSLVHLLLDEIYSVNALGLRLKQSAGTAFKFVELKKPLQYLVLYAVAAGLFFTAPSHQEVWRLVVRQMGMVLK